MSDHDQAPQTSPGVDPGLIAAAAEDLDELVEQLAGAQAIASGLAALLRQQAAAVRKEAP